ncbi:MAG TPA: FAD-binding protein [Gaiellaceae bacterium]|nr:FAD-binding protein [Gaiellaceae bacterium]
MLIAGAGMAGLCAAARAREFGIHPLLMEKGDRPGGSMLLSSCVIWRYRSFDDFRLQCPGGDEGLQRIVYDGFDEALDWLVSLGPEVVLEETPNPLTTGKRFDPQSLTDALVRAAGEVRLEQRLPPEAQPPLVLATGGFAVRYAREHRLLVRCNPWSEGDGFDFAHARGAEIAGDLDEFYGRAMPAPPAEIGEDDYVKLSQLWDGEARFLNERGEEFFTGPPAWHESDLAQAIARQPGGTAWFVVSAEHRDDPRVVALREAGGTLEESGGELRLHVAAAVTHTQGGIRVDERARVEGVEGLFAAGVDVGGISTGGYSSGLATALVLGRIAAEEAAK